MIGIILTGHGEFATGLNSAIELIAGKQEAFELVNFPEGDGLEELTAHLEEAMNNLKDSEGIIVLSDLAGGSPFKTAVEVSLNKENVHVIAGTNLAMLAELALTRKFVDDVEALVDQAINTGKDQVLKFEMKKKAQPKVVSEEEGI